MEVQNLNKKLEKICKKGKAVGVNLALFDSKGIIYSNFAHIFCLCTLKIQYLAVIQLSKFRCYAV